MRQTFRVLYAFSTWRTDQCLAEQDCLLCRGSLLVTCASLLFNALGLNGVGQLLGELELFVARLERSSDQERPGRLVVLEESSRRV